MKKYYKLIIVFLFISLYANAQTGKIKGKITNEINNEPIPFANVFIEDTEYGGSSDLEGNYIIDNVKPGMYILTISALGFDNAISDEIEVVPGKTISLDIFMSESALTLDEVTVKVRMFKKSKEAPVSLRSIGLSEIENSPGANRDVSKIIQNMPGVAAIPGQNRNDIIVRGGASNESRFYLDEVEIPNINHFATQGASGGTNGILNADFIRNLDFYSGAFPANKGNALSGVFSFKQIDGNKEKLAIKGSIGAAEASLTFDGPIGKNTTYVISARRSYLNFLFKLIGLPFLPTFNDMQFKIKTKLDDKNEITFIGLGAYDVNVLDRDIKEPSEFQSYLLGFLSESDQWNYTLGTVYKHFRKNGYTSLIVSRNMLNNRYYKYKNNVIQDNNLLNNYSSFEAENKFRIEDFVKTKSKYRINYGANFEYSRYENDTYLNIFTPLGQKQVEYSSNMEIYKYGAFGQISKSVISNRLSLSLGVRFDGNGYSKSMANPLEQFSPRFSASFDINDKLSVNMNAGQYYLLPSYVSLGYRDENNLLANKNNNIKYIESDHLIAGFSYNLTNRSMISIEGFYKFYDKYPFSIKDSLVLAFKPVDFGVVGNEEILSIGKGRAYGFEVFSQNRLKKDFNLSVSYTFAVSQFKGLNDRFISTAWDNRHILIITATKKFKKDWFLGIKWRYAGGLPYTPYDLETSSNILAWNLRQRPYFDYSKLNQLRFKPFHQLDVRIDKIFYFKKSSLKLYLDIQNAYNFKSQTQDIYVNTDKDGNIQIDPNNTSKYLLRRIVSDGTGTIIPTLGIIVSF